jgi:segregation and condensation protein B
VVFSCVKRERSGSSKPGPIARTWSPACAPSAGARLLTEQALETLAVVALRLPVTTEEVTAIRGAESYGTIETLRRQKLVARSEQRVAEGRAARWRTTQHFLDQFGLANLEEL